MKKKIFKTLDEQIVNDILEQSLFLPKLFSSEILNKTEVNKNEFTSAVILSSNAGLGFVISCVGILNIILPFKLK